MEREQRGGARGHPIERQMRIVCVSVPAQGLGVSEAAFRKAGVTGFMEGRRQITHDPRALVELSNALRGISRCADRYSLASWSNNFQDTLPEAHMQQWLKAVMLRLGSFLLISGLEAYCLSASELKRQQAPPCNVPTTSTFGTIIARHDTCRLHGTSRSS
jgi:hypothetical protein